MNTYAIITSYTEARNTNVGFFKGVCVKMNVGNYEISIAYDNSLGATEDLIRADMRIYTKDGDDVTLKVTGKNGVYHVSPKEIADAINYCIEHSEE